MSSYWQRVVDEYVAGSTKYVLEASNRVTLTTDDLDAIDAAHVRSVSFSTRFRGTRIENTLALPSISLSHLDEEHTRKAHIGYALRLVHSGTSAGFEEHERSGRVLYRHAIEPSTYERAREIIEAEHDPNKERLLVRARNLDVRAIQERATNVVHIRYEASKDDALEQLRAIALRGSEERDMSPKELDGLVLESVLERIRVS